MASLTSRLALTKPNSDPVTGDDVDIDVLNANFDKIDATISSTVVTSSTRPASPFQGQIIVETDTNKTYIRVGSLWIPILSVNAAGTHVFISGAELNVTRAAATDTVLYGQVTGDASGRLLVRADGLVEMGSGAGSRDTNLYRGAANLLKTDDAFQAVGFCSGAAVENRRIATSASITTIETVIQSVTFNAVAGASYFVRAIQHVQSSVAGDLVRMRLRYAAGASVTIAGTQLLTILPNCESAGKGLPWSMMSLFVAPTTGQYTIGVTLIRDTGTGTITSFGAADRAENYLLVTGA